MRYAFGIKPLFFSRNQDRFLFASEMPALLALEGQTPELNPQRIHDYLIHGVHDTGFDTFVRGVSHVPPAHLVRYDWGDPAVGECLLAVRLDRRARPPCRLFVRHRFAESIR